MHHGYSQSPDRGEFFFILEQKEGLRWGEELIALINWERRLKITLRIKVLSDMAQSSLNLLLKWKSVSHRVFANFWALEQSFSVGLKSLTSAKDGIHKGAKPIRHPGPYGFLEKSWPEYFALLSELTALKCVGVQAIRALSRKCGMLWRVMTPLDETTGLFLQGDWGVLIFEPIIIQKQWQNIQLHRMTAWSRSCRSCQSFPGPMERCGGWLHWRSCYFFFCSACWRNNSLSIFFFLI